MTGWPRSIATIVGFYAGWFALVLGAARGRPSLGLLAAAALLAVHVAAASAPLAETAFLLLSGALGYVADSALVLSGLIAFPPQAKLGWPCTLWMVALWLLFAATLNGYMSWIGGRYALSALVGAVAAPPSYLAGARLGAIEIRGPLPLAVAAIALEWAVAMPLLLGLAGWTRGARPSRAESA